MRTLVGCAVTTLALAFPAAGLAQVNPIQVENARGGAPGWNAISETTAIEGYADRTTIAPGETLGLHVAASFPGTRYRIELYRLYFALIMRVELAPRAYTGDWVDGHRVTLETNLRAALDSLA